jgi:hypothetical protein
MCYLCIRQGNTNSYRVRSSLVVLSRYKGATMKRNIFFLAIACLLVVAMLGVARNLTMAHAATAFPDGYSIKIQGTYPKATAYEFIASNSSDVYYDSGCLPLSRTGKTYVKAKTSSLWGAVAIDMRTSCRGIPGPTIIAEFDFGQPSSVAKGTAVFKI